ncbi:MAG: DNA gyrase subunit A [Anaerolineae bacterium]|nr:DNA gyrase subunit A [Anaerolineales bacterium]MCB8935384.1 DNA gyrase subunit A [Promineifilum sp.]MCW5846509.1 DNA gyrase subunit A [Anaerolineae bacterium]
MEIGTVNSIDINQEMRSSYLDYAMSVIVARALPDARDGLKPVHRRILYAMYDMGLRPNTPHRKSARVVGEVLGKYHPHGDSSVYDAMVRMAQDFSMRHPLVDGQGNFGSVDGDSPAAMRYTEARLAPIALELLEDLDKDTVNYTTNFDDSLEEPDLLPARLPNLLLNGSSGIAVGMATNIPPHNLAELCDAIIYLIDRQDDVDNVTLDELMEFVKGPDFPTSGVIIGSEGIRNAYATGRGRVVMRGVAEIEPNPRHPDRMQINITELPYQVNKSMLVERIAELVNKGVIDDISDLRDSSDRNGISVVVELKRHTQPRKVLNQLFKYTALQSTFGVQLLALVDKQPRLLSLKRALQIHIDHRIDVITRRTRFDLDKAERRQHILAGLLIAIGNLDEVIQTIRQAADADDARGQLMNRFGLTEIQATAILDMQLRRLAALERQKIEEEYAEITAHIEYLQGLLQDRHKILDLIKEDLIKLREKYGDARRTQIMPGADGDFDIEDLIKDEDVFMSITRRGYIKRTPVSVYRTQSRGGKGLIGMTTRAEDELEHFFVAGTLNTILFFSDRGKIYATKAYEIPELDRTAKGISLMNILPLSADEKITVALPVHDFGDGEYLIMITRKGRIKRVELSAFANVRPSGLIAINLEAGDSLRWVKMTQGHEDIILISRQAKGIRFNEEAVRPMGRTATGVNAMRLDAWDQLAGADVATPGDDLLIITEKGYGKRTPLDEYRQQGRYGQGVRAMSLTPERTGAIVDARVVSPKDEVTLISSNGILLRMSAAHISQQGRASQGVRVMDIRDGDTVASVAVIRETRQAVTDAEMNGAADGSETEIAPSANGVG